MWLSNYSRDYFYAWSWLGPTSVLPSFCYRLYGQYSLNLHSDFHQIRFSGYRLQLYRLVHCVDFNWTRRCLLDLDLSELASQGNLMDFSCWCSSCRCDCLPEQYWHLALALGDCSSAGLVTDVSFHWTCFALLLEAVSTVSHRGLALSLHSCSTSCYCS